MLKFEQSIFYRKSFLKLKMYIMNFTVLLLVYATHNMIHELVIDKINKLFLPTKVYCIEKDSGNNTSDLSMTVLQKSVKCDLLLCTDHS